MFSTDRERMFSVFDGAWDISTVEANKAQLLALGEGVEVPEGTTSPKPYSVFMDVYAAFCRLHMKHFGTTQAQIAAVRADLAITVSLSSVVPEDLEILADGFDLPRLPDYAINLYIGDGGKNPAVQQLSLHLRNKLRLRRI